MPLAARCTLAPCGAAGTRAYLAIAGGIDVPEFLGSRGTFMLGGFGGHVGRALRAGDVIHLLPATQTQETLKLPAALIPAYGRALGDRRALWSAHGAGVLHC